MVTNVMGRINGHQSIQPRLSIWRHFVPTQVLAVAFLLAVAFWQRTHAGLGGPWALLFDFLARSATAMAICASAPPRRPTPDAQAADLTLHPEFGYWVSLTREFRERAIRAGYEQTLAKAAALRALHAVA